MIFFFFLFSFLKKNEFFKNPHINLIKKILFFQKKKNTKKKTW